MLVSFFLYGSKTMGSVIRLVSRLGLPPNSKVIGGGMWGAMGSIRAKFVLGY